MRGICRTWQMSPTKDRLGEWHGDVILLPGEVLPLGHDYVIRLPDGSSGHIRPTRCGQATVMLFCGVGPPPATLWPPSEEGRYPE